METLTKLIPLSVVAIKTSPTVHPAGNTARVVRMIILAASGRMEEQTGETPIVYPDLSMNGH